MDEVVVNSLAMVEKSYITDLTNTGMSMYTSMSANTNEEKAKLFNAMNNPDHRISDMIGKTITVRMYSLKRWKWPMRKPAKWYELPGSW